MNDQDLVRQQFNRKGFGIAMNVLFDENNPEHKAQETEAVMSDWWGVMPKLELEDRLHWGILKVGFQLEG